jgi:hypothetical protein
MINLFKRSLPTPPESKTQLTAKVWLIDPVTQSITPKQGTHIESMISEIVGEDAECFKLDNHDNVVWVSDTDTNSRYAFYFEGMDYPFSVRRYSKALIISLGFNYWDIETINDWLRWYDKRNIYGD